MDQSERPTIKPSVRIPSAPSAEEAERRFRGRPTLLSSLTPEQLAAFDAFEGTQFVGRQEPKRRPGENGG